MKKKTLLIIAVLSISLGCLAQGAGGVKSTPKTSLDGWETSIAIFPIILYFLILMVTSYKLKKDGTKLSDLIAEKDPQVPPPAAVVPPAAPAPAATPPSQSVSRFIAFLTGLVSLTIGVCITTFYMYCYFKGYEKQPDLSTLNTIILGLGIGVLPYGFNKASAAMKS